MRRKLFGVIALAVSLTMGGITYSAAKLAQQTYWEYEDGSGTTPGTPNCRDNNLEVCARQYNADGTETGLIAYGDKF